MRRRYALKDTRRQLLLCVCRVCRAKRPSVACAHRCWAGPPSWKQDQHTNCAGDVRTMCTEQIVQFATWENAISAAQPPAACISGPIVSVSRAHAEICLVLYTHLPTRFRKNRKKRILKGHLVVRIVANRKKHPQAIDFFLHAKA